MTPPLARRAAALGGAGAAAWGIHRRGMEAQARGEDVIVLSVGDPAEDSPAAAVDAAVGSLTTGDHHYAPVAGRHGLRAAIADTVARQTDCPVDPAEVMVLAGTQNALFASVQVLFDPGDEVIVCDPAYVTYTATLRAAGAVPVTVPPLDGFRPDPVAVAAAVTDRTRGLLFASPGNPSGVAYSADELAALGAIATASDLWVVADEVYAALVFDGPHRSIRAVPGLAERTVVAGSVSKSHAMTGWRAGWAVAPEPVIAALDLLGLAMLYGLPGFVQEGARAALTDPTDTPAAMRDRYRRRRDLVVDAVEAVPGLGVVRPEAGMFVMVDVSAVCAASGLASSADFADGLLATVGVSVLDGAAFGASAQGWLRVSLCVDDDRLREAMRRLGSYVASLTD